MMNLLSSSSPSIAFNVPNPSAFSSMKMEQRLTAVLAGRITFSDETSSTIQTQFMAQCVQIAQEHDAIVTWHDNQIVALFGFPQIFEDDATRCAQLAWRLHRFVAGSPIITNHLFSLALENTVVKTIPTEDTNQLVLAGVAIDQVIHLLHGNPVQGIFATEALYSASQHEFEFETAVQLDQETPTWQLKKRRQVSQEARGFKTLSSGFVGRDEPLQAMLNIANNLQEGAGGIIIIEGEPGIGKSRLMREFSTTLDYTNKMTISGKCTPQRIHYPFSLFISLLASVFNIRPNDSEVAIHYKIEAQTANWPDETQEYVPYLYSLLGVESPNQETENLKFADPNQTKQQIFVAVRRIVKTLAQQGVVILLLDDIHWIDPISAELLLFLATSIATDPIFIVCTQRRQGADTPNDRLVRLQSLLVGQTEKIFLDRLSQTETTALLHNLLGDEIPEGFEQLISEKSEGNPYFIEEFVRMFIEQGYIKKDSDHWEISRSLQFDQEIIPLSLDALIQARIDALPSELKSTLWWAAILGFYFESALLEKILQRNNITEDLERLSMRLMVRFLDDVDHWQFHHPLLHTAVYNSIPHEEQREMHKQVATILQLNNKDETPEIAESLAYHLSHAGAKEEATPYLIKTGQAAIQRHAGEEALSNFQKASDFSEQISNPDPTWYWTILLGIGDAYRFLGRYPESSAVLETGLHLSETNLEFNQHRCTILRRLGETTRKQGEVEISEKYYKTALTLLPNLEEQEELIEATHIHFGLGWLYFTQSKYEQAKQACETTLAYAKKTNHHSNLAMAENLLGGIAYGSGNWQAAMRHTTRAMILREEIGDSWGQASSLGNLGILALESGFWDKAISYFQSSLVLQEEVGNIEGIVITQNSLANVYRNQGKFDIAEKHQRACLQIAQKFNMPFNMANASLELANFLIRKQEYAEAAKFIIDGKHYANSINAKGLLIELASVEAEWMLAQSRFSEATEIAQTNLIAAETIGNKIYEATCWRIIAESAYLSKDFDQAISAIKKAHELIVDSANTLERGITDTLAYRIYSKTGNETQAQLAYGNAEKIFTKLGASLFLKQLQQAKHEKLES